LLFHKVLFFFTVEAWVQSQASPGWIYGRQSGTGTGFSTSTSVFLQKYHSTSAVCLFMDTFIYSFLHHHCCITLAAGIVNVSHA